MRIPFHSRSPGEISFVIILCVRTGVGTNTGSIHASERGSTDTRSPRHWAGWLYNTLYVLVFGMIWLLVMLRR